MLNSAEIRNIKFSKAVGGYKQEEVDILLDKIEIDYDRFERAIQERDAKIAELKKEMDSMENSKESIQTVLLSAQRLADQIVAEAKVKSEEIVKNAESNIELITVRERELSGEFDRKASERKAKFEEEMANAVKSAEQKLKDIQDASEESIDKQQAVFDRLKLEVKSFKSDIMKRYKEHIDLLQSLPDSVTDDPQRVAAAVEEIYNKKSNMQDTDEKTETYVEDESVAEQAEIPADETKAAFSVNRFED